MDESPSKKVRSQIILIVCMILFFWLFSNTIPNIHVFNNKKIINVTEQHKTNDLNICFCSDAILLPSIHVVINSIVNHNINTMINIHYIHNIKNQSQLDSFRNYLSTFSMITFQDYYKEWNKSYHGLSHVSMATMLRIFIPDLIVGVDKILYLDVDIIVHLNLDQMFGIDCGEKGIAMKNSIMPGWLKSQINTQSANCGVMLMDLNTLRKNSFVQKCLDIHTSHNTYHDQHIINVYAEGKHVVLEPRFNIFLNQDDYLLQNETQFILHYVGRKKPYFKNTGKYQYLWNENDY
eukprot:176755_1